MKKSHAAVISFFLLVTPLLFPLKAHAQIEQVWETIVGKLDQQTADVDDPELIGDDDGLGPGEFNSPFKCGKKYEGHTYAGHTTYAVDFNGENGRNEEGESVLASANGGVVVKIPECGQIVVRSEGGYYTTYVHMTNITVREGDKVKLGQQIGKIGNVAVNREGYCSSTGPHLHTRQSKGGYLKENGIKLKYRNTLYSDGYPASIRMPTTDVPPRGVYLWPISGQCN